ncbi:type II toxin-antitoxin system Phd/YefM family antitoxin [Actinacidiphila oryziradicis]|uniref:Antitoxin n=2 Tax=Actinacidiphila oryziradicis TaxID=2571141 RepID=A0A4U0RXT9_9ACTN|nr:type II toxin-antitoxin system Phd/YefM family antitoxin [Actinacidiphila oryziradicis]
MTVMETYRLAEAREHLDELYGRVRNSHEHIAIAESGEAEIALIPIGEFREYERLRDEADLAAAKAVFDDPGGEWIPHDEFMAQLEAEDRAAAG